MLRAIRGIYLYLVTFMECLPYETCCKPSLFLKSWKINVSFLLQKWGFFDKTYFKKMLNEVKLEIRTYWKNAKTLTLLSLKRIQGNLRYCGWKVRVLIWHFKQPFLEQEKSNHRIVCRIIERFELEGPLKIL